MVNGPDLKTQNHYTYQDNLFSKGGAPHQRRSGYSSAEEKAAYGTTFGDSSESRTE
jgi:hypothetical protein